MYRAPAGSAILGHALVAVRAHVIVLLPLLGIPQGVVRLGHLLKLLGSILIALHCIAQNALSSQNEMRFLPWSIECASLNGGLSVTMHRRATIEWSVAAVSAFQGAPAWHTLHFWQLAFGMSFKVKRALQPCHQAGCVPLFQQWSLQEGLYTAQGQQLRYLVCVRMKLLGQLVVCLLDLWIWRSPRHSKHIVVISLHACCAKREYIRDYQGSRRTGMTLYSLAS